MQVQARLSTGTCHEYNQDKLALRGLGAETWRCAPGNGSLLGQQEALVTAGVLSNQPSNWPTAEQDQRT